MGFCKSVDGLPSDATKPQVFALKRLLDLGARRRDNPRDHFVRGLAALYADLLGDLLLSSPKADRAISRAFSKTKGHNRGLLVFNR
jgi:hypothetical protein